ncbi:MAG: CDP-diacylglycerol--serine O-phosphatidyltransferase [Bdellovibrionota bacterium]
MEKPSKPDKPELRERLYRRRYLVPNAVTFGNLFCGFLTIVYATSGRYEKAVAATVIAVLLDGLDGRVARRLNATSKFGVESDSFADLVSFGVAPAILMYNWAFRVMADEFGVLVCFIYVICAASRLARFNISESSLNSFEGMPTPAAAAMLVSVVYYLPLPDSLMMVAVCSALLVCLAYMMVSKIEFFSVKSMKVGSLHVFARLSIGILIALIWFKPKLGFLVLSSFYLLSGPLSLVRKKKKTSKIQTIPKAS